ncbi:MAG TPA: SDR family oxidoreductase [Clostridia bacterium]|nr:SDR family oxidoreductase [Clostridia bacterium]
MFSPGEFRLDGRTAIVTGASRGIGEEIALGLAAAGARVALVSRTVSGLKRVERTIKEMGQEALAVPADVSDEKGSEEAFLLITERVGPPDVLVNNAGISPVLKSAEKLTSSEWDEILAVNLRGPFLWSRMSARSMIERGRGGCIINVASIGAIVGLRGLAAYCASKAGLVAFTRVAAIDWAKYGIRVNAVAPGYTATDMTSGVRKHPHIAEDLMRRTPMGRFAQPHEIVGAVVFLASDAAAFITGQVIPVDGGWTAS